MTRTTQLSAKQVNDPAGEAALRDLAGRINEEHRLCESALRSGLGHALEAGRLLLQAKKLCGHGLWDGWLTDSFEGSDRTARAYMRVAREWPKLADRFRQRVADLTFSGALRVLAGNSRTLASKPKEEQTSALKA